MVIDTAYWVLCLAGAPIFWLLPRTSRWSFLFLISFAYLYTLAPWSVFFLILWSLAFYFFSPVSLSNVKYSIAVYLVFGILCFLLFFKYLSSAIPSISRYFTNSSSIEHIIIPLGISYYTFKLIHYAVDIRRGTITDHTLSQFLCYIFMFPIFTAGPIEQFSHFLGHQEEKWSMDSTIEGFTRIAHGLIKKFIFVEVLLDLNLLLGQDQAISIVSNLSEVTSSKMWVLLLVTYLRLYLGFSAYSDIAIGSARLFGFRIMENFNWPIFAPSIVEFWRRWHMTLAGWVQSYVYMPLIGLYRQPIIALFTSFFIIGIWHEFTVSRITWGFYHASAIMIYIIWSRSRPKSRRRSARSNFKKLTGIIMTQIFLVSSMAFFVGDANKNIYDCVRIIAKLFWLDLPHNSI